MQRYEIKMINPFFYVSFPTYLFLPRSCLAVPPLFRRCTAVDSPLSETEFEWGDGGTVTRVRRRHLSMTNLRVAVPCGVTSVTK